MSKPISEVLNESRVTDALTYLAQTDESLAEAKASVSRTKFLCDVAEAVAFKSIQVGSIADKNAEVKLSKAVQDAWETHFKAVVQHEKLRARREREILVVEIWRSINANRRQGQV
jgi:hypothetical protein